QRWYKAGADLIELPSPGAESLHPHTGDSAPLSACNPGPPAQNVLHQARPALARSTHLAPTTSLLPTRDQENVKDPPSCDAQENQPALASREWREGFCPARRQSQRSVASTSEFAPRAVAIVHPSLPETPPSRRLRRSLNWQSGHA